ncbi:response regulator transcription factor [Xylocopilactobacillus apicola]|uniref:DNA-binding response regulator n=1 Tax=Xylocopilactobacillus apicola TaxID=2932184 RepID=A0AAU9DLS4_9LACO|nr:response regulator transcription factor [Xylocopilactobacillus apicola]BDR59506.1 DNA-binding response regulator [Xylocopilactobacillus apicola]
MHNKILLVEDDTVIAKTIQSFLAGQSYEVKTAQHFNAIDKEFDFFDPDLVIMDLMLPHFNGFHWLEEIRKTSKVPVIFLTSAGDDPNLVMAMNLGADDFLAKPIELTVLLAKIQGSLRRVYQYQISETSLQKGGYVLEISDNRLSNAKGSVSLSPIETKLLGLLFEKSDQLVSREEMIKKLWEGDDFIDRNTLAVTVNRLRKKVSAIGLADQLVTVKGAGYKLELVGQND